VAGLAGARAVAFAMFLFIAGAPLLFISLTNSASAYNPVSLLWLFQPMYFIGFIHSDGYAWPVMLGIMQSMALASLVAVVLGAVFLLIDRRIALRKSRHENVPAASAA